MANKATKSVPEGAPKDTPKSTDFVTREKGSSPFGTGVFLALRCADPLLQYAIMTGGLGSSLIRRCGASTVPLATTTNTLGLAPHQMIMFSVTAVSSIVETFWLYYISQEQMPAGQAAFIAAFHSVSNSLNTLVSMCALTSAVDQYGDWNSLLYSPSVVLGTAICIVGMLTQTVSELQRKAFKDDPKNKGKPYGGGLFSLATHINYGGFTIWRTGYALAAGGWAFAALSSAWFIYDFSARAIPSLEAHCEQKYGEAYTQIAKRVHYKLIPGVI